MKNMNNCLSCKNLNNDLTCSLKKKTLFADCDKYTASATNAGTVLFSAFSKSVKHSLNLHRTKLLHVTEWGRDVIRVVAEDQLEYRLVLTVLHNMFHQFQTYGFGFSFKTEASVHELSERFWVVDMLGNALVLIDAFYYDYARWKADETDSSPPFLRLRKG